MCVVFMLGVGRDGEVGRGWGRGVVGVYPSAFFISQSLYLCKLQHLEFKGNS